MEIQNKHDLAHLMLTRWWMVVLGLFADGAVQERERVPVCSDRGEE